MDKLGYGLPRRASKCTRGDRSDRSLLIRLPTRFSGSLAEATYLSDNYVTGMRDKLPAPRHQKIITEKMNRA